MRQPAPLPRVDRRDRAEPAEVPVYIPGRAEHLGAVVTVPADASSRTAVILMAGRARDRTHRNGMWVKAARALAERGFYVARLDYPGVGNSTGPPQVFGLEDPPAWAIEDTCRFLGEHTPVDRVLLVATCFGGRLALHAAPGIPEVRAVAIVAAPTISRNPTLWSRIRRRVLRALGFRPSRRMVPSVARQQREGNVAQGSRVSRAFARALRRYLRRGRILFLYGEDDFTYDELRFALGRVRVPRDRYEVEVVPGEIHTFSSVPVQDLTVERVVAWCSRIAAEIETDSS